MPGPGFFTNALAQLATLLGSEKVPLDNADGTSAYATLLDIGSFARAGLKRSIILANGNYVPVNPKARLLVVITSGGGGGSGAKNAGGTVAGADGATSSFDVFTAAPGKGAGQLGGNEGGLGGTVVGPGLRLAGNGGGPGIRSLIASSVSNPQPGMGGASSLGGVAAGNTMAGAGASALVNSGSGGGGAVNGTGPTVNQTGGGGGGSETASVFVDSPLALTYAVVVGGGGAGGVSDQNGGDGGSGRVVVYEL